jgi:carbamoyl-phosphate synthase large subunit
MGIRSFPPTFHSLKAGAKTEISCFRERYGIQAPKGLTLNDGGMIHKLPDILNFPLIVKGWFYEAEIAYTPLEVEKIFRRLSAKWGLPVIVQEYIIGDEYDVVAVGGAVPMRKLRLTDKGKAWGGITIGDSVEPFDQYTVGAMFIRHSMDMVYPLSMLEAMTTSGELHLIQNGI